ncbi:hypothetical protein [Pseudomonas lundensis]|uniref:hypothetical protein n=1 Tax=Pseudomonas lundensis TaxID=86185 RepID=UPI0012FC56F4|nr:hypothetical protein [Pseudomonas lundensis]
MLQSFKGNRPAADVLQPGINGGNVAPDIFDLNFIERNDGNLGRTGVSNGISRGHESLSPVSRLTSSRSKTNGLLKASRPLKATT